MTPDAAWPNLPAHLATFTPEMHAAHRSPKGVARPEDLVEGLDSRKSAKALMKFAHKPHLKLKNTRRVTPSRRKRKRI